MFIRTYRNRQPAPLSPGVYGYVHDSPGCLTVLMVWTAERNTDPTRAAAALLRWGRGLSRDRRVVLTATTDDRMHRPLERLGFQPERRYVHAFRQDVNCWVREAAERQSMGRTSTPGRVA